MYILVTPQLESLEKKSLHTFFSVFVIFVYHICACTEIIDFFANNKSIRNAVIMAIFKKIHRPDCAQTTFLVAQNTPETRSF